MPPLAMDNLLTSPESPPGALPILHDLLAFTIPASLSWQKDGSDVGQNLERLPKEDANPQKVIEGAKA